MKYYLLRLLAIILLMQGAFPTLLYGQDKRTLKEYLEYLVLKEKLHYIYDAALNLNVPYTGADLEKMEFHEALNRLFSGRAIKWEQKDNYILLFKEQPVLKRYTISGYVYEANGESLVNATVVNLNDHSGTLSNAYGFYSMTLVEGVYQLRFSYVGCKEKVVDINLKRNISLNVNLESSSIMDEVVVIGDLNSPLNTTQTGKTTLGPAELNKEYSLLSSPDLIKTLQHLPGVAAGTEMISGLYVHGGTNDGNLFLLDGTPLYQINHLGGLFSAFNVDAIKNVDFYKSGFPARYGGRLSSVIDVRTKDGDVNTFRGSFSIGLLDGRILLEGPIVKGKTSFIIAARRSWAELFTTAAVGVYNASQEDSHLSAKYAFHDINAKITHSFSNKSKLYAAFYSGNDGMRVNNKQQFDSFLTDVDAEYCHNDFQLKWGNITTSLNWNYQITPQLFSTLSFYYTRNTSLYKNKEDNRYIKDNQELSVSYLEKQNRSKIDDIGYRLEVDYRPHFRHDIRLGSSYTHHSFMPQTNSYLSFNGSGSIDTLYTKNRYTYGSNEFSLYAEDDISLSRRVKLNLGLHGRWFEVDNKNYYSFDPRVALSFQPNDSFTYKLSYTKMSQFVHLLSNSYLNLPTDYWVPSTSIIPPKESHQLAAGVYTQLTRQLRFSLEGYYTSMRNLIEYDGGSRLDPSVADWEKLVKTGKGRAYGVESSLIYFTPKFSFDAHYTLSWSQRKFVDFYPSWYSDKYDNRHKITLGGNYHLNKKIDIYGQWTFHSGDKITMPTQYITGPSIPGIPGSQMGEWIYEEPNNVTLPSYHRLDIGANFRHTTKRGYERIWNISIYNLYSRMNALYGKVEQRADGTFKGTAVGVFPIIPSFSYTLKF